MSTSESVIQWLYDEFGIEADARIDVDSLGADDGSMGMFTQPTREETTFIDGSRDVTEHFNLIVRIQASTDEARRRACEKLEGIESRVRALNVCRRFPRLDNGRVCFAVGVGVSGYLAYAQGGGSSEYQLSIKLSYTEGIKHE